MRREEANGARREQQIRHRSAPQAAAVVIGGRSYCRQRKGKSMLYVKQDSSGGRHSEEIGGCHTEPCRAGQGETPCESPADQGVRDKACSVEDGVTFDRADMPP